MPGSGRDYLTELLQDDFARLHEIAARPNRPDLEPDRGDPAPEPQYVHIERVAGGNARRPRAIGEHLPGDDRAEPVEQHSGERLFDRRQRDPRVAVMEEPVLVEQ